MLPTIDWQDDAIVMIDQRKLPGAEVWVRCRTAGDVARAIRTMVIRGAPAIGVAAAMGVALGMKRSKATGTAKFAAEFQRTCELVAATRPTAVNLFWAVDRMKRTFAAAAQAGQSVAEIQARLEAEARAIHDEDVASCRAMGRFGAECVPDGARILTHCNAGALATAGYGSALGVVRAAAEQGKRVQAQGGAKNYIAVMPDANIEASVANIMGSAFGCAGQRCLAGSVVVAVGDAYEPLKQELVKRAGMLRVGYGMNETTQMGTVISAAARERIGSLIQKGMEEGAQPVLDGRNIQVSGFEQGSFVGPTILDGVEPEMTVAKEEIFGPVLSIMHAPDFDSAVEMINQSRYGNAASLFTSSGKYAREFKYRVRAGNIGINVGVAAATASFPFGGQKESFFGDLHGQGPDAIEFFTDKKILIERWL
jgi:hypothetical protein